MKKLLIIDGNSLLHRAWHALPPLTTKSGQIISGVYGFTTMMLRAIEQLSPTHIAVAFDLPGKTFRHEEFKEYKAQREKKPQEIYDQIPLIKEVLEAFKIPHFSMVGFEADDVIGSLAKQISQKHGFEVVIATGDLDALQLVDEKINAFIFRRGVSEIDFYDISAFIARFGFAPPILVDYKAMRGDTSDNIPGIPGIGEKTATELLLNFGNLDQIYVAVKRNDPKISASISKKLVENEDIARLAYRLCAIKVDLDLPVEITDLEYTRPTHTQVSPVFGKFEFTKLLDKFQTVESEPKKDDEDNNPPPKSGQSAPSKPEQSIDPVKITSDKQMILLANQLKSADFLAFYSQKESENQISLFLLINKVVYEVDFSFAQKSAKFKKIFESKVLKICFDLKKEYTNLAMLGVEPQGPFFDLLLAAYSLYAGTRRLTLESILSLHCDLKLDSVNSDTIKLALPYFGELQKTLAGLMKLEKVEQMINEIEMPLSRVISKMERRGIKVDVGYFNNLSEKLASEIDLLTTKIHQLSGIDFNINSPKQLTQTLFGVMGITPKGLKKTAKGGAVSTAAGELEKLRDAHPIIAQILHYRELTKLKSTYVDVMPQLADEQGRVHTTFNQAVAATGRLSSTDPNLQNIPTPDSDYGQKVRNGFVAEDGFVLVSADYSQFELRVVAHLANETVMIEAFRNNEDIHLRTAIEMFGEDQGLAKRSIAKTINFGILYGMGPQRLAESAGISFEEARNYIDQYFSINPNIAALLEKTKDDVRKNGYVETLFGRKRFFPNLAVLSKREEAEAMRQAFNMPIQGTQADLVKMAMLKLDAYLEEEFGSDLDSDAAMMLQVHDEVVLEVRKDKLDVVLKQLKSILEGVYKLKVPLVVNVAVGTRWGEMKKV